MEMKDEKPKGPTSKKRIADKLGVKDQDQGRVNLTKHQMISAAVNSMLKMPKEQMSKVYASMKEEHNLDESLVDSPIDISINFKEGFDGIDLEEDVKEKLAVVFESSVNAKVSAEVAKIQDAAEDALSDVIKEHTQHMTTVMDKYSDRAITEWVDANKAAVTSSFKVEIAESLFDGMRELFTEHNINIPDEKVEAFDELTEKFEDLKAKNDKALNENLELKGKIMEFETHEVVSKLTEGMTATKAERIRENAENISYSTVEEFENKLSKLVETVTDAPASKSESTSKVELTESAYDKPASNEQVKPKVNQSYEDLLQFDVNEF